jgi:plastocyanin
MEGTITVVGDAPAPDASAAVESPTPAESAVPVESAAPVQSPATPSVEPAAVSIIDLTFEPATIEVDAGSAVEWTNEDPFAHTVTAREGDFDSGTMDGGETFSQTFSEPGTYDYFCAIHPSMAGTVTVTP